VKVDADSVVIYQELPSVKLTQGSRIHNALLIDFLPSQKNTINLQTDGTTKPSSSIKATSIKSPLKYALLLALGSAQADDQILQKS
jgi:hypothetical protein